MSTKPDEASNDTKLTVLSGHYKDTQKTIDSSIKSRDRTFLTILVILGVMAFQFFSPQASSNVLTQIVQNYLDIDTTISMNYISTLIWFGLFAAVMRYFQTVINLEKLYHYVHNVEQRLSKDYGGMAFTREGKAYLRNYPLFSDWLHIVYRFVFPSLLVIAVSAKIANEWQTKNAVILPLLLNTAIFVMILVSIGLYVYSLQKLEKKD